MRIPISAILMIATVLTAVPARAQTYDPAYPVCLQIYQGWNDYYFECAYTSLPQCNASASGRAAQCIVNPYYAGRKQRRRDGETGGIAASIEGGVYRKPCRYPSDLTNEEWALVEPLIARPSVASGAGDMRAMRSLR